MDRGKEETTVSGLFGFFLVPLMPFRYLSVETHGSGSYSQPAQRLRTGQAAICSRGHDQGEDLHNWEDLPNSSDELVSLTLRGRTFTVDELRFIQAIVAESPTSHRFELSKRICQKLGWFQPNGRLKDRACRDVLARLDERGWVDLPPPRRPGVHRRCIPLTPATALRPAVVVSPREIDLDSFSIVTGSGKGGQLWNEYMERYHPLGYGVSLGAHIKYFVRWRGEPLSCLVFGGAAWKIEARDRWIGWSPEQRQSQLGKIVNNTRFLVLPWARIPNLASRILGLVRRRLPEDWYRRYAYRPVLLETFVDSERYTGACYRAANWDLIGETKGRGRMDRHFRADQPRKRVFVYPLIKDVKTELCR